MAVPVLTRELLEAADELGIRLEITEGLPTWQLHPLPRHQLAVQAIRDSVRRTATGSDCGCVALADVEIRFPDGSTKRPDISIFCQMPPLDETVTQIPPAVVEVVSPDSKRKDYELNPPFYLKFGIADVLVVDPVERTVSCFSASGRKNLKSPATIQLACGCTLET